MADSLQEFEDQLHQEALASTGEEVQFTADEYTVGGTLVRKDPDGTVYEFDPKQRAWFPKVHFGINIFIVIVWCSCMAVCYVTEDSAANPTDILYISF